MKRFTLIFGMVTLLAAGVAFARLHSYDETKPPHLALPDAYSLAMQAMGGKTNQFYCLGGDVLLSGSPDGEWLFTFSSTNNLKKYVFVFFDKKTHVQDRVSF